MKLTNGCAIFGDKNGPQGSGTYFSINKVMASLRAPSYANLIIRVPSVRGSVNMSSVRSRFGKSQVRSVRGSVKEGFEHH